VDELKERCKSTGKENKSLSHWVLKKKGFKKKKLIQMQKGESLKRKNVEVPGKALLFGTGWRKVFSTQGKAGESEEEGWPRDSGAGREFRGGCRQ